MWIVNCGWNVNEVFYKLKLDMDLDMMSLLSGQKMMDCLSKGGHGR